MLYMGALFWGGLGIHDRDYVTMYCAFVLFGAALFLEIIFKLVDKNPIEEDTQELSVIDWNKSD